MSLPPLWRNTKRTWPSTSGRRHRFNAAVRADARHRFATTSALLPLVLALIGMVATLSGCVATMPGNPAPIVKIGLVAPFEGLCRPEGYALLPIVRQKLDLANQASLFGPYRAALVATNNDCDGEESRRRSIELALDPDVVAILGMWDASGAHAVADAQTSAWPAVVSAAPASANDQAASLCPDAGEMAGIIWAKADELALTGAHPIAFWRSSDPLGEALANLAPAGADILPDNSTPKSDQVVVTARSAEEAADRIVRWRSEGWKGQIVGGPDLVKPWFATLSGQGGEGTRALICGDQPDGGDAAPALAGAGIDRIIAALIDDIALNGTPTRDGVAQAIRSAPEVATWTVLTDGIWLPDDSAWAYLSTW